MPNSAQLVMAGFELGVALWVAILVANMSCQQMERRIMNGIEKDIKDLPWVVAFCTDTFYVVGTGSIVSDQWVLTVGHTWEEPER